MRGNDGFGGLEIFVRREPRPANPSVMRFLMPAWKRGSQAFLRSTPIAGFLLLGGFSHLQAEDPAIEIIRGHRWVQASAGVATAVSGDQAFYFLAQAVAFGLFEPISNAQVTGPIGGSHALSSNGSGDYQFQQNFATSGDRDTAFPSGRYNFSATLNILGATRAHTVLAATTIPAAPHIANFTEAQQVDSDNDFTLHWDSFAGAADDDQIQRPLDR